MRQQLTNKADTMTTERMGKIGMATLTESNTFDGVDYELWIGEHGDAIRAFDVDSGNLLPFGITLYPSIVEISAAAEYAKLVAELVALA